MTFCNQQGCGAIATKLAHWPGKEQALPMCSDHATWAREVISATGGVLRVEPIDAEKLDTVSELRSAWRKLQMARMNSQAMRDASDEIDAIFARYFV